MGLWQGWERQVTAENKEWGRKVPDSVNCPVYVDCVESREVAEAAELVQEVRGTGSQGHGSQLGTFVSTCPFYSLEQTGQCRTEDDGEEDDGGYSRQK